MEAAIRTMNDVVLLTTAQKVVNAIMDSIDYQENPNNRIITDCEFNTDGNVFEVWIRSNCDGWCEDVKTLDTFFHILEEDFESWFTFCSNDFIGLTETEAKKMIDYAMGDHWYCEVDEVLPFI